MFSKVHSIELLIGVIFARSTCDIIIVYKSNFYFYSTSNEYKGVYLLLFIESFYLDKNVAHFWEKRVLLKAL